MRTKILWARKSLQPLTVDWTIPTRLKMSSEPTESVLIRNYTADKKLIFL